MSPLRIISFHETKCLPWVEGALSFYIDKMKYWVDIEKVTLKPTGGTDRRTALQQDWQKYHNYKALLQSSLIVLDEKGQDLRSLQWGSSISLWLERKGGACFLIGPTYGLDSRWREQALMTLKLSSLTFPHELALVVLFEQIYRSLTIHNRLSYHCE